jgi:hypothetical protein
MNRCAAVKKKGSTDPCKTAPLLGHTLCGRHARMRSPVLWVDANRCRTPPIVKIQACVRGWLVRRRLWYAGPGVIFRKDLANDEDIISCTEKEKVHPMDFFSFLENDKVWWFEFSSLWTWCVRNVQPLNPYTKVPLSTDTRQRLRTIWGYKRRHREVVPEEPTNHDERLRYRANILVQHFEDYGFVDVNPSFLLQVSRRDFMAFFILLGRDIETVLPVSNPFQRRMVMLCANRTVPAQTNSAVYALNCFSALLYMITLYKDPYVITFSILSAFYRA